MGFLGRGFNSPRLHHNRINSLRQARQNLPPQKARDLEAVITPVVLSG
jgi:hypothetical protein